MRCSFVCPNNVTAATVQHFQGARGWYTLLYTGAIFHTKICTETNLREKNPLPHWGFEPASAARRTRRLTQLTEVHPRPKIHSNWQERKLGKLGKTVKNGQQAKPIRRSRFPLKKRANRRIPQCTLMAQSPKTSQVGRH